MNVNKINQNTNYNTSDPNINIDYSALSMPKTDQGTGYLGKLIPIHQQELLPTQKISISIDAALQFNPLVSNLFHEINGEIMGYAVPLRILWEDFETFITGGPDGEDETSHPVMNLKDLYDNTLNAHGEYTGGVAGCLVHTLADYFGMPINADYDNVSYDGEISPTKLLWSCYNEIYNECIRFPDIEPTPVDEENNDTLNAYWEHNYYTRSRIYQQRGEIPSVPVSDELQELAHEYSFGDTPGAWEDDTAAQHGIATDATNSAFGLSIYTHSTQGDFLRNDQGLTTNRDLMRTDPHELSSLGMDMNDFVTALGIMRYQVNNSRIQPKYVEQLKSRWGARNLDLRLDRPEYIGSQYFPVAVEPVKQTSYGDTSGGETPQGYVTGHMTGGDRKMTFNYEADEHCILMLLMVIRPKASYEGGLNKMWVKNTKFDYPTPELYNLPDKEVKQYELMYTGIESEDDTRFGWQGIYEEYRTFMNETHGLLRPTSPAGFHSYTLCQYWTPGGGAPTLNEDFMRCIPDHDRIFQYTDQPAFVYFARKSINTAIPLPVQSEPAELSFM